MSKKWIDFGVSSAWLVGCCEKCDQPSTGEYRTDDGHFIMECVNCYSKTEYTVKEHSYKFSVRAKIINRNQVEGR